MSENKKLNNCVILFDQNDFGTYFTGQTVSGTVRITLEKAKKLKGIKLQICGYAACQWREKYLQKIPVAKINPSDSRVFFGREDYIASTTYLVGAEHSSNFVMDAGTYTYTFACPIPTHCPSSFEGTYGHIRYLTKVTFIRNGAADRIHNVGFTVLKLLDLNQENRLIKSPATIDAMENVCFLQSKAVHMKVDLQQTGYVPGQYILVSVNVNNQSSVDCQKLIIILNLLATYISDTPAFHTVSEKICLTKKIGGCVPKYCHKTFAESIRIPATAPTCENLSRVVRVSYELCVVAAMNSLMRNPRIVMPIIIGNVPLTQDAAGDEDDGVGEVDEELSDRLEESGEAPITSTQAQATANNLANENAVVRELNEEASEDDLVFDLPPPTYEEAMFMSTNIADNDANTVSVDAPFTPRYPVYNVDDNDLERRFNDLGLSAPPNLPPKRRRRRRRQQQVAADTNNKAELASEKISKESPIQI